ncbi:hypothetical protein [Planosporangium mesophilum]|uniref:Uncharacterized protein n=1 Tax=Planosporangium mesophilum TaxID=689768 RepID=A0A8J3T8I5_9ACTN|nr:hypothetical protein [Planosporangium mesophilum]NJC83350.1 hypothetical protein [Planosporangium mesophilum]GII21728.1 hypothetical protein Pme01_13250 [Planosporangium mesophilum]
MDEPISTSTAAPPTFVPRLLATAMLVAPVGYLGALCLYGVARLSWSHAGLLGTPVDPKDLVPAPLMLGYVVVSLAVLHGQLPAAMLLVVGVPQLGLPAARADRATRWLLLMAVLATGAYLAASFTPFGADLRRWIAD